MSIMELTWHDDPGHGWLEVSEKVCTDLGIILSEYSFVSPDGRSYFAEEDSDALKVCGAINRAGFEIQFNSVYYEKGFKETFPGLQYIRGQRFTNIPAASCGVDAV
jgi:hypothetical protein